MDQTSPLLPPSPATAVHREKRAAEHNLYRSLFFLVVALAVVICLYLISTYIFQPVSKRTQAVFLTNGQVYFGHTVKSIDKQYLKLKNIYYIQINQPLQASASANTNTATDTEYNLIKLGNEIHGPQDEMLISRSQILFIEDLRDDSQIVRAMVK